MNATKSTSSTFLKTLLGAIVTEASIMTTLTMKETPDGALKSKRGTAIEWPKKT